MAVLLRAFSASFGTNRLCLNYDDSKPIRLSVADLAVTETLQLRSGASLVALSLRRELTECKSERGGDGGVGLPRWFLVDGRHTRYLGDTLSFIAAADLDADGSAEYFFWYAGYNRDGYVLFYNKFKDQVRYLWSYH